VVNQIGSTYIELDDVRVPVGNLLGEENKGFPLIMSSKSPR
jgi:alkylation response protein AidB-like acyl-CoA dehydrogenase